MNCEIFTISREKFLELRPEATLDEVIASRVASTIIVGMYGNEPVCFIGLTLVTMVTDDAYIWMITTPYGASHSLWIARHAKRFVATLLGRYNKVYGHCNNETSARWLRSLGAVFTSDDVFEIRRS